MPDPWIHPDWPAPANVHAVVTTRHGPGQSKPLFGAFNLGLRSGDDEVVVRHNRAALAREQGMLQAPLWLHQVHGTDVVRHDGTLPACEPDADAAVSDRPGTALAILTADCLPVLFCTADGSRIAAAHAGWRGLCGGVLENAVAAMDVNPATVMAWMGPCIGQASYEIDTPVYEAFDGGNAPPGAFVATRPGHWRMDLTALARQRLQAAGVTRIHGGRFDTFTDERLYSYRREGARSGRFASVIHLAR